MNNFTELAWATLGAAGISTSLLAALAFLCRTWIGERLKSGIKYEYDKRLTELSAELSAQTQANLAKLKSEVERQTEKLRISALSFSEVQKATIPRKIEAVDVLWEGVIKARAAFPSSVQITDILLDKEVAVLYTDTRFSRIAARLDNIDHFGFFDVGFEEVQRVRPHLGEYTWAIYCTYRGVLTRALYLMSEGKTKPEKVSWFTDRTIQDFVSSALGKDKASEFIALGSGRFKWLHHNFDVLIFTAIDTLLTGQNFSDAALKQAERMEKMISSAQEPREDQAP